MIIELTNGGFTIVEEIDYINFQHWSWYQRTRKYTAYVQRYFEGQIIVMHRNALERTGLNLTGLDVDHRDGNGLNNLHGNLRIATRSQNHMNRRVTPHSSKYKGVSWDNISKRWQVRLVYNGILTHFGRYDDEEDAARRYNMEAEFYYGQFANLNEI